ncbi:hypothetical protein [Streptomyces sp. NPDC057682]|uniref:hypothetical protein n=1 Tax=Streptomyces sp. NPDC057682 TaxID=3346210 RepID=UPI0036CF4239
MTGLLVPLLTDPDPARAARELHRGLAALDPPVRPRRIPQLLRQLPPPAGAQYTDRVREFARQLVRTAELPTAVCVGVVLLARFGTAQDVPVLRTLGLLRDLVPPVVSALDALDRRTAAVVRLGDTDGVTGLRALAAVVEHTDSGSGADVDAGADAVRECLLALPRIAGSETARRIAEAAGPAVGWDADPDPDPDPDPEPDVDRAGPVGGGIGPPVRRPQRGADPELTALLGVLLFRMTSRRGDRAEILSYPAAPYAYGVFARDAGRLPPTLDHYALVLSAADELRSGSGPLYPWRPGAREAVLAELESILDRAAWRALLDGSGPGGEGSGGGVGGGAGEDEGIEWRRRIEWARRSRLSRRSREGRVRGEDGAGARLRIEVVERDPADPDVIEARILVDGRPVVPEYFGRGPANAPEYLLDRGLLRATAEPREVRLAEAYCSEGCCGALYVTIRRDGDQVRWYGWRCPAPPPSPLHTRELPELRFDAAAYDAEVARAERDDSWTWPARRTARLVVAALRDRPEPLERWGVRLSWAGTRFGNPEVTALSLLYDRGDGYDGQYLWLVPDDGAPPEERAAAVLERLATEDPRTYGADGG